MRIGIHNKFLNIKRGKDELSNAWEFLVCCLAKNEEFYPKSWLPDLNRIEHLMNNEMINKLIENGGKTIINNNNELIGVIYNDFIYMPINQDNSSYISAICYNNNLKTTEDIMTSKIRWEDIVESINIIDRYLGLDKENDAEIDRI